MHTCLYIVADHKFLVYESRKFMQATQENISKIKVIRFRFVAYAITPKLLPTESITISMAILHASCSAILHYLSQDQEFVKHFMT